MPTVTVDGEKSFEVEAGKKLVLAIEDAAVDIMHRCGGNARCTTCRVVILAGEVPPMEPLEQERLARDRPRAKHAAFVSNPRAERPLGARHQPLVRDGCPAGNAPARLISEKMSWRCKRRRPRRRLASPGCRESGARITCASAARRISCSARCAADLAAAARTTVKLGLAKLLLTGTEWHGKTSRGRRGPQNERKPEIQIREVEPRQSKRKPFIPARASSPNVFGRRCSTEFIAADYSLAAE